MSLTLIVPAELAALYEILYNKKSTYEVKYLRFIPNHKQNYSMEKKGMLDFDNRSSRFER